MKKFSFFCSFSAVFLLLTVLLSHLVGNGHSEANLQVLAASSRVIVLDAGHGGEDGGAIGNDGTAEKDLNLAITKKLSSLLRAAGYTVIETRTEDVSLGADAAKGHRKSADLKNRLAVAARYEDALLVSIHMNSYPLSGCRGLQVWHAANDESKQLADAVQSGVKALLQPENNRKIKQATSAIYLLRKAEVPAILIECGFLSTPEECEALKSEDYQQRLALAIFSSLSKKLSPTLAPEGK